MCFGSSAVEEPVQFQIDESFLKLNLAASRLHEISRLVVYWRGTGSDITSEIQAGVGLPSFNTLRPRQSGRNFPDDIFKCIFLNENV